MIQLPNGCWCSEMKVHPKNWKSGGLALLKENWYIWYKFHDPEYKYIKKYQYGKLVAIKGMNVFKNLNDRRSAVMDLIKDELFRLRKEGYNPITKKNKPVYDLPATSELLQPNTRFNDALNIAFTFLKCTAETKRDFRSAIYFITKSAEKLDYDMEPVHLVTRQHIKRILHNCQNVLRKDGTKKVWSSNQFNHYRKYLSALYSELVEAGAVDVNIIRDIRKEKTHQKLRELITADEQIIISNHFKTTNPEYHRFLHIFFYSGARPIELLQIKRTDVDLESGYFKVTVNKGRNSREELRPILDVAMPFWVAATDGAEPDDYIFALKLKPGKKKVTTNYVSNIWLMEVKRGLGINKDLYALKATSLDEIARSMDIQAAADMAGHSTKVITIKHYATGEKRRQAERLKRANISFAG